MSIPAMSCGTNNLPSLDVGGATVVNDLVFTATFDGTIYAFNATTGAQVWTYNAGGGINSWPSVSGDTLVWPVGQGNVPSVLAFKLGANTAPVLNITPKDGGTVPAGDVTVSAQVFNFNIVDKLGQAAAAGEGHLHFFMDVDAPTTQGQPAVTAQGTYAATKDTTYTWHNVTPGTHTFSVELANNDHTPLNPPVIAKSTVTVVAATPAISITVPANNSIVPAGDVTIAVQCKQFQDRRRSGTGSGRRTRTYPLLHGRGRSNHTGTTGGHCSGNLRRDNRHELYLEKCRSRYSYFLG